MNVDSAKRIAVMGKAAPIGEVVEALDVLFLEALRLERELFAKSGCPGRGLDAEGREADCSCVSSGWCE